MVRAGYERVAEAYQAARGAGGADLRLLAAFADLLPAGARVLDAGCGGGVPAARYLSGERGFDVLGIDIALAQVELSQRNVPTARFVQADMTQLEVQAFPDASFDGICSLYAIIHVPLDLHPTTLAGFLRLLRPGGLLLLCTGFGTSDDYVEEDYFGVPMYWSHLGREGNLQLVAEAGFDLLWERPVVEDEEFGGGVHLFILARKPVT